MTGRCCGPTCSAASRPTRATRSSRSRSRRSSREAAQRAAQPLRRLVRALLGGLPLGPARVREPRRPDAREHLRQAARTRERRRHGRPAVRVETGKLVPEVWERWLACDPVRLARERTATRCARRARSGSTPAATTSTTSTSPHSRSTTRARSQASTDEVVRFELHEGTPRHDLAPRPEHPVPGRATRLPGSTAGSSSECRAAGAPAASGPARRSRTSRRARGRPRCAASSAVGVGPRSTISRTSSSPRPRPRCSGRTYTSARYTNGRRRRPPAEADLARRRGRGRRRATPRGSAAPARA